MNEYISTFTTGFSDVIEKIIGRDLPGASVIDVYDGLIRYKYSGDFKRIKKLPYFNNTYYVIRSFNGKKITFNSMVKEMTKYRHSYLINYGTFRIRFSQGNRFCGVEKSLAASAEKNVMYNSSLKINRLNPSTEVWYIIRTEGVGFYCQLLFNRKATEKELHKGELRPEFAYLMCEMIPQDKGMIVCDPFCGYGSIIKQLKKKPNIKKIYASDIDDSLISTVSRLDWAKSSKIEFSVMDARRMESKASKTVDAIITDPPWGFYENIDNIKEFYLSMLKEMLRILKDNGIIVLLSARKEELLNCCQLLDVLVISRVDTLVNGKKAAVFGIKKKVRKNA